MLNALRVDQGVKVDKQKAIEVVKEFLLYDANSGCVTLRRTIPRVGTAGREIGYVDDHGYVRLTILGHRLRAHQVAWITMTGDYPRGLIDHINGNKCDNRWSNLRDVDTSINGQNIASATRAKKISTLLGTTFCRKLKKWKAQIGVDGKEIYLGLFESEIEAHKAYLCAKSIMHDGSSRVHRGSLSQANRPMLPLL